MSNVHTLPTAARPDRAVHRQDPLVHKDLSIPHLTAVLAVEAVAKVTALDRVLVLGDGPIARAAAAVAQHWGAEVVTNNVPDGGFDVVVRTRSAALPPKALRPFARVVDLGPAASNQTLGLPDVALNLGVTRFVVHLEVYHQHAPETLKVAGRRVLELRRAHVLPRPLDLRRAAPAPSPTPIRPLAMPPTNPPVMTGTGVLDMIRRLL